MAVDACVKPNFLDDDDEDEEEALVFKRTNTASKRNAVKAEIKKSVSQKHNGLSQRHVSDSRSPNGQSSSSQKGKTVSSAKASTTKSSFVNSKESKSLDDKSNSSSGPKSGINDIEKKPLHKPAVEPKVASTTKLSVTNSKESKSMDDKSNHSSGPRSGINDREKKPLGKPAVEPKVESEDSDDDKPLSFRISGASKALPEGNSLHVSKGVNSPIPCPPVSANAKIQMKSSEGSSVKRAYDSEDSEDEIPLSSKFKLKSSGGSSVKKAYDSDDDKPIASKSKLNGSIKRESELVKSPKTSNKRPLSDVNTPAQSSVKKPKSSNPSVSTKTKQVSVKAEPKIDEDDDLPISQRMNTASDKKAQPTKKKTMTTSSLKVNKKSKKIVKKSQYSKSTKVQPNSGDGQKWTTLVHSGVIFPPPYKPHGVKMLYNRQPVDLTPEQEEVATMFAVMKDTEYATKQKFLDNFWNDWRGVLGKNHTIKKFELCDFTPIYEWHQKEKEKKKQMTTEEKKTLKEEKMKQEEKYMWAVVDGVREKVGNFRVEPPGLFRGRGEHPKMGKLKKRIRPSDITINIGKGAPIPECPIPGERWKEVKHDNTVTWLAFWNDPINPKEIKYVFLAASSSLKGQSDKEKYEKARLLKDYIHNIRSNYTKDFTNKDVTKRQIAVATYLIDKLALRAGNEKDDDEADTVGCCTLKVENVELVPPNKLQFDFLGKDSIRYENTVEVELPVYKAVGQFKTGKEEGDDLFDKLDTSKLNAHLKELMPGLTAKVFRTYNASITLDDMLNKETKGGDVGAKIVVYQHANKEVAIICNHQRTVSKSHSAQMSRLSEKMDELKGVVDGLKEDLARAKKGKPLGKDADGKLKKNLAPEALERKIAQTSLKIEKMERDMRTKEDLKTVALGTSKINYLDPRISVAWCKRQEVPIEKIFNKSLLAKFAWAMDVDPDFRF